LDAFVFFFAAEPPVEVLRFEEVLFAAVLLFFDAKFTASCSLSKWRSLKS
jgi:hypothetical protein